MIKQYLKQHYAQYSALRKSGLDDSQAQDKLGLPKHYKSFASMYKNAHAKTANGYKRLNDCTYKFNPELPQTNMGQRYQYFKRLYELIKCGTAEQEIKDQGFNEQDKIRAIKSFQKTAYQRKKEKLANQTPL